MKPSKLHFYVIVNLHVVERNTVKWPKDIIVTHD